MEIKTCATCRKIKPLDKFYFHHSSGKHEKHCKQCKNERQKLYNKKAPRKSGVPHEQLIIDTLRSKGIYACSGKRSRSRWVDVVAFGCVAIEAKLGREKKSGTYVFSFSQKQIQQGVRADLLIFIIQHSDNSIDYHILKSDSPILFHGNGERKQEVSYTPESDHWLTDKDVIQTMDKSIDQWGLILAILQIKIKSLRDGTFEDFFTHSLPPVRYKPSNHNKSRKKVQDAPKPVQVKRKPQQVPQPAKPMQMWFNSMLS